MWMIDYGATWVKFYKVDKNKSFRYVSPPTPRLFFYLLQKLKEREGLKKNEVVVIGFPGVVKNGKILNAPNLDEKAWKNVQLDQRLRKLKLKPLIMNDTDLHGLLIVKKKGIELVIALGTGFGSSFYMDGFLLPNSELGHHPFLKGKTYEELLGYKGFMRSGRQQWVKNVKAGLALLHKTFNPDKIYITGGLCDHLYSQRFPSYVKVVGNPVPTKKILKSLAKSQD